jgi:formyltetrahydrofolate synthetase
MMKKDIEIVQEANIRPIAEIAAKLGILHTSAVVIVPIAGTIMTMPGLSANPSAENIDINKNGVITGLF